MKKSSLAGTLLLGLLAALPGQAQSSSPDVAVVPHHREDCFEVALTSPSGPSIEALVQRTQSVEQIPFVVSYEVDLDETFRCSWLCLQTGHSVEGHAARFILDTNAHTWDFKLSLTSPNGEVHTWLDEGVDFPLHNHTEILLDGSLLSDHAESLDWSVQHFDPHDVATLPIQDSGSDQAILISAWPNIVTVMCHTRVAGRQTDWKYEVVIYNREGAAWEVRSVYAPLHAHGLTHSQIEAVVERMVPILKGIGYTHVTHQEYQRYGYPDESGAFTILPHYDPEDPRGAVAPPDDVSFYFKLLRQAGFNLNFDISAHSDNVPDQLAHDYSGSGYGTYAGFMQTDGYLYSDHGLESMFLGLIERFKQERISIVSLEGEEGQTIEAGGSVSREFYSAIIEQYREAGFEGLLAHASSDWASSPGTELEPWNVAKVEALLNPTVCGIPYSAFDLVSVTCYVPLAAGGQHLSIEAMRENALRHIESVHYPFHLAYDKPFFIADLICNVVEGCSAEPLASRERPLARAEQLCWYAAWLRALLQANTWEPVPWIHGITAASYFVFPETQYYAIFIRQHNYEKKTHLNDSNGHVDLRMLLKAFMSDKPLQW